MREPTPPPVTCTCVRTRVSFADLGLRRAGALKGQLLVQVLSDCPAHGEAHPDAPTREQWLREHGVPRGH